MSNSNLPPGVSASDPHINPTDGVEVQIQISTMDGTLLENFVVMDQDHETEAQLGLSIVAHIEHRFMVSED